MTKKLKWPGFNEKGSVLIGLVTEDFCYRGSTVVLDGIAFSAKEELHVTLISSKLGALLQDKINQDRATADRLRDSFEKIDWSFSQTGPVYILSRNKNNVQQMSIIMQIDMPGVSEFYGLLKGGGVIDVDTPAPPPHVTLFTFNCRKGIAVPSADVLNKLTVKTFALDEFNALLKV